MGWLTVNDELFDSCWVLLRVLFAVPVRDNDGSIENEWVMVGFPFEIVSLVDSLSLADHQNESDSVTVGMGVIVSLKEIVPELLDRFVVDEENVGVEVGEVELDRDGLRDEVALGEELNFERVAVIVKDLERDKVPEKELVEEFDSD